MENVVARAGLWFTLLIIAIVAVAGAHDTGFAVHMWIVAGVALIGLWASVARVDYGAISQGILRSPPDPGRYDDEPIRWGVIATEFWAANTRPSAACARCTPRPSSSRSEAMR